MDLERAKRQTELRDAEARLNLLSVNADVLITEFRLTTDPLLDDFPDMDMEKASDLMKTLYGYWQEARKINTRIGDLKAELGG